jgi:hypothetical protein
MATWVGPQRVERGPPRWLPRFQESATPIHHAIGERPKAMSLLTADSNLRRSLRLWRLRMRKDATTPVASHQDAAAVQAPTARPTRRGRNALGVRRCVLCAGMPRTHWRPAIASARAASGAAAVLRMLSARVARPEHTPTRLVPRHINALTVPRRTVQPNRWRYIRGVPLRGTGRLSGCRVS